MHNFEDFPNLRVQEKTMARAMQIRTEQLQKQNNLGYLMRNRDTYEKGNRNGIKF